MLKKGTIIVLLLFVFVPVFGGGKNKDSGKVKLKFWHWRTEDTATYDKIIALFEEDNPGIEVVQTAYKNTEYNTVLSTAVKGDNAPDIYMLRAYGGLEQYVDYLEPLSGHLPELQNFSADSILGATSQKDGKVYGVPYAGQSLVIYYNTRLYDEQGLSVPETWGEFIANLEALKAAGITPLANGGKDGWTLEVVHGVVSPNVYGGTAFFEKIMSGATDFNNPAYIDSLRRIEELKAFMPDIFMGVSYTDMQIQFITEDAAHFIGGSWEGGYFATQNPDLAFDIFAAPPTETGGDTFVSSFSDGSYGMALNSSHKDEAARFLQMFTRKEVGQILADELKAMTEIPGVSFSDPFISKVIELRRKSTPYIHLVGFRYQKPTGSELIQSGLQGLIGETMTAEEVAANLQQGISTWFTPGN